VGVQLAHTADLDPSVLRALRALLVEVFGEEMTAEAWDHTLGGLHALAWDGGELIGHAAVVQRRVLYRDRALRSGNVECVAVRADRRRRGVGGALMAEIERVIRGAYEMGVLGATEDGAALYPARGWRQWQGELWTLSPSGPVRTPSEEGDVYVYPVRPPELDLAERLTCDWREGHVW
jgi:aminoglycoside 2'-N-acetyltransferase I